LAAALLGNPEVLVLDEPANGLDPIGIAWLRGFLRGLADKGHTILVSSHQLAEMQHTVDDVLIINNGKLIAEGPIATVAKGRSLEEAFLDLVMNK
jgi:ABC-2 type transport system ATP-binding protein